MDCVRGRRRSVQLKFTEFLEPGVGPRRWIGRLRLHAGKYILGITAPTGTGVQALPPWDPRASPFDSSYIGCMLWRVRNSRGRPLNAPAAFIHPTCYVRFWPIADIPSCTAHVRYGGKSDMRRT
jgi:hypothetical protein